MSSTPFWTLVVGAALAAAACGGTDEPLFEGNGDGVGTAGGRDAGTVASGGGLATAGTVNLPTNGGGTGASTSGAAGVSANAGAGGAGGAGSDAGPSSGAGGMGGAGGSIANAGAGGGTSGAAGTIGAGGAGASGCADGLRNNAETDLDCGGSVCAPCQDGAICLVAADCESQHCATANILTSKLTCRPPTCSDGIANGDETGTDCGGPSCSTCADGQACLANIDCSSGLCDGGVCECKPLICSDVQYACGTLDDDCGGTITCTPCSTLCSDGVTNASETDVDCGGPDCMPCPSGDVCNTGADCASGVCKKPVIGSSTCQTATCSDGVLNGSETDKDCGGPSCNPCAPGLQCTGDDDCALGPCDSVTLVCGCTPLTCADIAYACGTLDDACGSTITCDPCSTLCGDGVTNGNETDTDCGGPDCTKCASGKHCSGSGDCTSGSCIFSSCF